MRFFIVGTGRCGSTVIRNILNSRSDTFVFNETHWIPHLVQFSKQNMISVSKGLDIIRNTNHVTGKAVTDLSKINTLLQPLRDQTLHVRDLTDAIGRSLAHISGKEIWADKTPDYGPYMSLLQYLWPDCKFIHMIRNGVDVAQSMSKHPGYIRLAAENVTNWVPVSYSYQPTEELGGAIPTDFINLWHIRLKETCGDALQLKHGSYKEMRFEDLILRPNRFIEQMCEFLMLDVDSDWLKLSTEMVDTGRFENRSRYFTQHLREADHQLLSEFGY